MNTNKILTTVYVPFLNEKYDVLIPINKKVGTIKNVLVETINSFTNSSITSLNNLKLLEKDTCKELDNNVYVASTGLSNGSSLILL